MAFPKGNAYAIAPGETIPTRGRPRSGRTIKRGVAKILNQAAASLCELAVRKALEGDAGCLAACVILLANSDVMIDRKAVTVEAPAA
jgi:hypothetical protein